MRQLLDRGVGSSLEVETSIWSMGAQLPAARGIVSLRQEQAASTQRLVEDEIRQMKKSTEIEP